MSDKPIDNNHEDINEALRSETDDILGKELKTDVSTTLPEQKTIVPDAALNESVIPDAQWYHEYITKLLSTSSPVILQYHKSEIENVNAIIKSLLSIIKWVSFATTALVALFVILDKDTGAIISLTSGGVIDTILGILTELFNCTLKSKKTYFDAENDSSKFNKMLLLIQTISDQKEKNSVTVDILRKYFDIQDKNK